MGPTACEPQGCVGTQVGLTQGQRFPLWSLRAPDPKVIYLFTHDHPAQLAAPYHGCKEGSRLPRVMGTLAQDPVWQVSGPQ